MAKTNKAYIAGLMDGDGAIMAFVEKHSEKKFKLRIRVVLKITQKSREHLVWIQDVTGFGEIYRNRGSYDWILKDQKQVLKLIKSLKPYIRIKSRQAKIAQCILDLDLSIKSDFLEALKLASNMSEFNIRSKRSINVLDLIPVTTDSA